MLEVRMWDGGRMDRDHMYDPLTIWKINPNRKTRLSWHALDLDLPLSFLKDIEQTKEQHNNQTMEVHTWGYGRTYGDGTHDHYTIPTL